jgi:c-di-GMP-binding flagellar brake protein YcgR
MTDPAKLALETYARDIGDTRQRTRLGINISFDRKQTYVIDAVGVIREDRYLIVSAPTTPDGSLIAVRQGQMLNCSRLSSRNAFKFEAVIEKLVFEPLPLLYLKVSRRVSQRVVRQEPRALVSYPAVVRAPHALSGLLVDLSLSGARFATYRGHQLALQQTVELSFKLKALDREQLMTVNCGVVSAPDITTAEHPQVRFYGLQFGELPETDRLMLKCVVLTYLVEETDVLAQLLLDSEDAPEVTD